MADQRRNPLARRGKTLAALLGALTFAAAGCEPRGDEEGMRGTTLEQAETVLDRRRAPGEDNGLELLQWSVTDDDTVVRRALGRHLVRDVPLGASAAALLRHGFLAAIVRDEQLPSLLADFGGTTVAAATWHGQIPEWRELAGVPLDEPRVSMIDGRAERLAGGRLRLMVRAWTVPMEDGAAIDLDLVPQWIGVTSELRAPQARDALRGRVFADAAIRSELPRATALVLVSTPPQPKDAEDDPEAPASTTARRGTEGPPGGLPPTIGEILLTDSGAVPPRRIVLVLRARLPDMLFPTASASSGTHP